MLLLLLVACGLYFVTGQHSEGFLMLGALTVVAGTSVFQELRSEKALRALAELIKPKATVIRNRKEYQISSEEVVVGDLVRIAEGDRIPADGRLVSKNDLSVNESLLTGESLPVEKSEVGDPVYAGTTVVRGVAVLEVTAVGPAGRIGSIGAGLKEVEQEKTQLQRQVSVFVRSMALVGITTFLFVWGYHYLLTKDLLHGLFHGLTLAMSVIPEEIPVAVSVFMALGAYRMIGKRVLARRPQTVEALGAATVICVDKTGTITRNRMSVAGLYVAKEERMVDGSERGEVSADCRELVRFARLASEQDAFDAMEQAIVVKAESIGYDGSRLNFLSEYPLSGTFPMMTHVYADADGKRIVASKGAPEGILSCCQLDAAAHRKAEDAVSEMALQGFRVLAVAKGAIFGDDPLPSDQHDIPMIFLGLVGLSDPVKENIPEVLSRFYQAGIDVKMITGDYPLTACHIAAVAGFPRPNKYLTGDQISTMNDTELSAAVKDTEVFARVTPETKLRLIRTLKAQGEVVAMTGDGVNDAPALKAAHIGVSMGKHGTEVARQASSLVLLEDDLSAMVDAVAMGRKIYANLKKAIQYIIAIHLPILSVVLLPIAFGWPYLSLFTPVHVIFLELVMGPTCSIVFENEPMEPALMSRRPRKFSVAFFTWRELSMSLLQGLVISLGLMIVAYAYLLRQAEEETVRSVVFTTLVLSNILLTLTGRSRERSVLTTIRYRNKLLPLIITITVVLLVAILVWPPAMSLFGMHSLDDREILLCLGVAILSVIWVEFTKKR
jgi:Ca2+-transporting ATPase